jgi:hypothetical protein
VSSNPILRTLAIAASAALLATALAVPATAASPTACRVTNLNTGVVRNSLQKAVWQASPKQRLTVRGTCHGRTKISKNLHISGVRRGSSGRPTLDGDDTGRVVLVKLGARVTIRNLQIRDGSAKWGGGVRNKGTLVLAGSTTVRGNEADFGGGVWNDGTLILRDSSTIRANRVQYSGGGVLNDLDATLKLKHSSSIRGNEADFGGGVQNHEILTLMGSSSIRGNVARNNGGGVHNEGALTLKHSSTIADNEALFGGGVLNLSGSVTLNDSSSIRGNEAFHNAGGIYGTGTRINVTCGGNVHDNTPNNCYP